MKVLGLVGSPRRGGNTDLLVAEILAGAAECGFETEKLYLYPLQIEVCVDCKACKKGSFTCVHKDDMAELNGILEGADVIVFGTPLYWYGPTAKMKLLLDRLRPFVASKRLRGKRAVLVVSSEEGADACRHVVGMFNLSFDYLGVDLVSVLLPRASELGEVKGQPIMLSEAKQIGRSLKQTA